MTDPEVTIPGIAFPRTYSVEVANHVVIASVSSTPDGATNNAMYWLAEYGGQYGFDANQLPLMPEGSTRLMSGMAVTAALSIHHENAGTTRLHNVIHKQAPSCAAPLQQRRLDDYTPVTEIYIQGQIPI